MNRRHFINLSGAAGLAAVTTGSAAESSASSGRDYYELRRFILETESQKKGLDAFLQEAAIPALNRLDIKPVGVFRPSEGLSPVYVLLRYQSLESVATLHTQLAQDSDFVSSGADFLNAPADAPAFKRIESSLMIAFQGMPRLERPVESPGRVFQLRTYESPSWRTGLKKIEMFNDAGEIRIFREVGLSPVFFGQTLVGAKLPNLTYMLAFKSVEERDAAWKRFVAHPDWKRLSAMPEYTDKAILCPKGVTNLPVVPAEYSQI